MRNYFQWPTLAIAAVLSLPLARAELKVGAAAPDFTATDSDGKTVNLKDYKGNLIVLEWFNQECPFVKKHYGSGNMQKLQSEYTKKGVVWLSIASSAPGKQGYMKPTEAVAFRKSKKDPQKSTALILDPEGKVGKLYDAKVTPHMFVIDRDGTLIYNGAIDDNNSADPSVIPESKNFVAAALDSAMKKEKVLVQSNKPYGCGVKYN